MASEEKTLDAARMVEMDPNKHYALLFVQPAPVKDTIGEMLVKRMMSIHTKGNESLERHRAQQ